MENLFYGRKMAQVCEVTECLTSAEECCFIAFGACFDLIMSFQSDSHVLPRLTLDLPFIHYQVFDLKGSLRNRNVKTEQGKESCEVVLLDENLLKLVHDNPLYIRSHCKAILRAAIHSDAYFLSSHLIIDYSLLVGRDDASDQLVVGIIGASAE